jgi:F0F1-type ATP synthase assembly protein I
LTEKTKQTKSPFKGVGSFIDLGFRFALSILLTAGGGYWLDNKLKTLPLFLVLGLLLGATSGFLTIYRAVSTDQRKDSGNE